jgi:hypothetical protein
MQVWLCKDGVMKGYLVSRLVAEAFIPNPDNKPEVNHKDTVKSNNRWANLEWVDRLRNVHHAFRAGCHPVGLIDACKVREVKNAFRRAVQAVGRGWGLRQKAIRITMKDTSLSSSSVEKVLAGWYNGRS